MQVPPPSFVRYTNRRFVRQRKCTKRLASKRRRLTLMSICSLGLLRRSGGGASSMRVIGAADSDRQCCLRRLPGHLCVLADVDSAAAGELPLHSCCS